MRAHGGIAEIIRTRQFPGIHVSGPSRGAERPRGYDRASDTYDDIATGRRMHLRGAKRREELKAMGLVDLQDFKTVSEFEKYRQSLRKPDPPIDKGTILECVREAKQLVAPHKTWREMQKEARRKEITPRADRPVNPRKRMRDKG